MMIRQLERRDIFQYGESKSIFLVIEKTKSFTTGRI